MLECLRSGEPSRNCSTVHPLPLGSRHLQRDRIEKKKTAAKNRHERPLFIIQYRASVG
jgi:hypothetical protein